MRPPTPLELLRLPGRALDGGARAVETLGTALVLVPRAAAALDRVEALLDEVADVVAQARVVVAAAGEMAAGAGQVVDVARVVTTKADRAVAGATGLVERADGLLLRVEPLARKGLPLLDRFVQSLSPAEVEAAVTLVDRLPVLLRHLDEDVLPVLRQLDQVGPDIHRILEVVEDLRVALDGVPGVGLLKRLGERKDDDEA